MVKEFYHRSFWYKSQTKKREFRHQEWRRERLNEDIEIIKVIFDEKFIILNGPFKGLKYFAGSTGSSLLPKILGSYEEPIQKWVTDCISRKYSTIINIGCAEGYYAAGFASLMPEAKIIAYDIDKEAIENVNILKKINNLSNIEIRSNFSNAELNKYCKEGTLILCDIEGSEKYLIDPDKIPNLKFVDLVIESHDFIYKGVTDLLIKRFEKTHIININLDYPVRINEYLLPKKVTEELFARITNEYRQPGTKFLFMKSYVNI